MNAPTAAGQPGKRRTWIGLLLPAALMFCALVALGTWQLQRKAWKENLIATLDERLAAPPQALPPPATWPLLDAKRDEYKRVRFRATLPRDTDALVLATGSAFRPDVSGLGFWVFAPARLADGSVVVVNRGFVPSKLAEPQAHYDQTAATIDITGVLRWPDARHWFTPKDSPRQNVWYVRDPAAIAAAKNWGKDGKQWGAVSPFYVEQEAPAPPGGFPQPGKLSVHLRNEHLQYAITWFGLALVLVVAFAAWALTSRRERPDADAR